MKVYTRILNKKLNCPHHKQNNRIHNTIENTLNLYKTKGRRTLKSAKFESEQDFRRNFRGNIIPVH